MGEDIIDLDLDLEGGAAWVLRASTSACHFLLTWLSCSLARS